ncbi:MAG: hypothetical protein AB7G13_07705 [Lautropia sp.]
MTVNPSTGPVTLERGQRFTLDVDAPALVQAFSLATISLHRPANQARPRRR